MEYKIGNVVRLKKVHPCGNKNFKVVSVGNIITIECEGCKKCLSLDKAKLDKLVTKVVE